MSHVITYEVVIDNLDALERMCVNNQWEFRRGQKTYQWVGVWVDDSPVPQALFADQKEYQQVLAMSHEDRCRFMKTFLGQCEHAIHFPGHEMELGLTRVNGQLIPVWDWASSLTQVLGNPRDTENNIFVKEYARARVQLLAEQQGYTWTETRKNNTYEIEVQVS